MGTLGRSDRTTTGVMTLNRSARSYLTNRYAQPMPVNARAKSCWGCVHDKKGMCKKDERFNFEYRKCCGYERV